MSEQDLRLVIPGDTGHTGDAAAPEGVAAAAGGAQYEIVAKARELSDLLSESEEVREFAAAEEAMLNDPEAMHLLKEAEEAKQYTHFTATTRDKALMKRSMDDYHKADAAQRDHPPIRRYNEARERLQALLERLNAIITHPITGDETPGAAGGSCGSGGCSGCSR